MSMNKVLAMFVIFVLLSGLFVFSVKPVVVQAVSDLSVPQFSVKQVADKLEVTIKNQPFTPYTDKGKEINLYYIIEYSGSSSGNWQHWVPAIRPVPVQSGSQYTVVSNPDQKSYPVGWQLYFRVRAVVGTLYIANEGMSENVFMGIKVYGVTYDVVSDYSDVQTITIVDNPSSSAPSQTTPPPTNPSTPPPSTSDPANPTLPQYSWQFVLIIILVTVCIIVIPVVFVLLFSRQKKNQFSKDTVEPFGEVKMV